MKPRGWRVNKMLFTSLLQLTHRDCSADLCPCSTLQRKRKRERQSRSRGETKQHVGGGHEEEVEEEEDEKREQLEHSPGATNDRKV